jgi:ubiquinone/menaquinone biosynthesis C-methylase UbiE
MPPDRNQTTYQAPHIVRHYTQINSLQPAESAVLEQLRDSTTEHRLSSFKMLDIGVGGGRTTQHFAPLVADYVGMDYSPDMIAACRERFPGREFLVGDARDMSCFADDTFDFILFSFNGLDYVNEGDRLQVLKEIHRIGKPGSYFCFSSHNLQSFERGFDLKYQWSFNPITTYANLIMLAILRWVNRPITLQNIKTSAHLIVKDDSHNFRLDTYYVRPQEQIRQLENYFENIQVYSWQNGAELKTATEQCANFDQWLYYFCSNRSLLLGEG